MFLWVYLVTKNRLQGSSNSDDYDTLLERLDLLPTKWENLYDHMWRSLNGDEHLSSYSKQAALFFCFHDYLPLHVFDFTLALDDALCYLAKTAKTAKQQDFASDMVFNKAIEMRPLLQTRCAGLLEVVSLPENNDESVGTSLTEEQSFQVQSFALASMSLISIQNYLARRSLHSFRALGDVRFFHPTARDFLLDKLAGQRILEWSPHSARDTVERLVSAHIAQRMCGIVDPAD